MKEPKTNPNRIPAADGDTWQSWTMPVIGDDGQVLSAEKRQAEDENVESIEDVEVEANEQSKPLTAEQLADIVKQAENEGFTEGREEGLKNGYDEGFKSGQQQGLLEMRQQLTAEQKTFQSLASNLLEPIDRQDDLLESMLLTTLERLTRAVVARELTTDSGDMVALVRQAVAALPGGREQISVHLNPDDLSVVETYCQEHALDWHFQAAPDIAAGGVKVVTTDSTVDHTIERRLDDIIESFLSQHNVDENTSDEQLLSSLERASASKTPSGGSSAFDSMSETMSAAEPAPVDRPNDGTESTQAPTDTAGAASSDITDAFETASTTETTNTAEKSKAAATPETAQTDSAPADDEVNHD
ncbi:flagellar assembly protein FliH [Gilvimarinus agarilyticus]|uniref:FliH/SctL family protein n=1 Tax=Gilvimarinus sp. 2_MG-2023 TaxID=3062666 RepID=UPI001C0A2097|nr:FliH/SctL family protein [Gilvimarinus sp. 2_MG-2023]MBU2887236.1 flagellar assembly protein FliH [Gilvimarinus agarilyticus]MDO6571895.1 FliH/SctL family protein [Gilvimarinus sp. 2_MG-2023]